MQHCSLCSIFHVDGADVGPAADLLFATIHNSCCLCNQALPAKLYTLTHLRRGGVARGQIESPDGGGAGRSVGRYQVARELQSPQAGLAQSNASCFTFQNSQVKQPLQSDMVHNRLLLALRI